MRALFGNPESLLLLLGGLVLAVELTVLAVARPITGLWVIMAAAIATSFGVTKLVTVAEIKVAPLDVATIVTLVASAGIWIRGGRSSRSSRVLLLLCILAVARGLGEFGLQVSVNAGRDLIYFTTALLFVTAARRTISYTQIERLWLTSGAALTFVAICLALVRGVGDYSQLGSRVLNSQQALIVAEAAVLALASSRRRQRNLGLVAMVVVILSQQRTVWAMTAVTIAVLLLRSGSLTNRRRARELRFLVAAAGVSAVALFMFGPPSLRDSIQDSNAVSTQAGTLGWRVTSGAELLTQVGQKAPLDRVVGQPAGTGFTRYINEQLWTASPHNMYLMVLISLGAVGLGTFVVLIVSAIRRSANCVPVHAILVGLLIYGLGYQLAAEQAILVGSASAGVYLATRRVDREAVLV